MKQTVYFTYQLLLYAAMAIMLVPAYASQQYMPCKKEIKKAEAKVVKVENKEEDLKTDLLFRF